MRFGNSLMSSSTQSVCAAFSMCGGAHGSSSNAKVLKRMMPVVAKKRNDRSRASQAPPKLALTDQSLAPQLSLNVAVCLHSIACYCRHSIALRANLVQLEE